MALKASSTNNLESTKNLGSTNNIEVTNERGQMLNINSRRSSDVEVIKVTVEDIIKPKISQQQTQFIQAAN